MIKKKILTAISLNKMTTHSDPYYEEEDTVISQTKEDEDEDEEKHVPIVLEDEQLEHCNIALDILQENRSFFDVSATGRGKTVIQSKVAKQLGLRPFVVCPVNGVSMWKKTLNRENIDYEAVLSYPTLIKEKHGYLSKSTHIHQTAKRSKTITTFTATDKFTQLLDFDYENDDGTVSPSGILLIFDEAQHYKNNSLQYKACLGLAQAVHTSDSISRICILSRTPIDKTVQVMNALQIIGFLDDIKLGYYSPAEGYVITGANCMFNRCRELDETLTNTIIQNSDITKANLVKALVHTLYKDVVLKYLSHGLPPKLYCDKYGNVCKIHIRDLYCKINKEDEKVFIESIQNIITETGYGTEEIKKDMKTMQIVKKCRMIRENRTVKTLVRLVTNNLLEDPHCKTAIACSHPGTLDSLLDQFEERGIKAKIIDGKTPKVERDRIMEIYQQDNNRYRVLLLNLTVASTSYSINDTCGRIKHVYIIPSYNIQDMSQIKGRFYRFGQQADVYIYYVYGDVGVDEASILDSLKSKTSVLKGNLQGCLGDEQFPTEYAKEYEDGKDLYMSLMEGYSENGRIAWVPDIHHLLPLNVQDKIKEVFMINSLVHDYPCLPNEILSQIVTNIY